MAVRITDAILESVEKPSRYIGNEWNSVVKEPDKVDIRFAFCFPDNYEVGMSHLGMRILYHMLNQREDTYCERVFAPWVDMEQKMRDNKIPLFALETKDAIKEFDIIGFTLQYEMSYTNIINMLDLAGVPIYSRDRKDDHPIVCAGGPCAVNPEPLADIIDFFVIGEGEEVTGEVLDAYKECKKANVSRQEFLNRIVNISGIYVPSLYTVKYNEDGTCKKAEPIREGVPKSIRKRIIKDLSNVYYPEKIIVPYSRIVHDRVTMEIFRGCIRGCRFCQAGYIYRPVREKSAEKVLEAAKKLVESTGYDEISLASLSTSDYTEFDKMSNELLEEMESRKVNLALPSLRVDSFSLDLMEKAQKVRKSGLTFAPEAGTQRLRDVINKGVTEDDLINSVSLAFSGGWGSVKLYFMIGLPTESNEDIEGIAKLGEKVVEVYKNTPKETRSRKLNVTISASSFVPKPFTPFQWEPQDTIVELRRKQEYLRGRIKQRNITYNWHDTKVSFLEAVFARGDRRTGKVLVKAWEKGCKFDSWGEHFKYDEWIEAFKECDCDPHFYATRKRSQDEEFPWDHIDVGVSKKYLQSEHKKAYEEKTTPNCRENCSGCGVSTFLDGGVCIE